MHCLHKTGLKPCLHVFLFVQKAARSTLMCHEHFRINHHMTSGKWSMILCSSAHELSCSNMFTIAIKSLCYPSVISWAGLFLVETRGQAIRFTVITSYWHVASTNLWFLNPVRNLPDNSTIDLDWSLLNRYWRKSFPNLVTTSQYGQ